MALAAGTVWECNASATAANVNSGGFNPTNTSFATDLTTDANTANTNSPIVSSASYNFASTDEGHWVYIKSGTSWTPGWYQILTTGSNKATLKAAIGQAIQTDTTKGYPTPKYSTNTVAGCATVGTPTGGTFTIDYSQKTAAVVAGDTNLTIDAADNAKVTSSGHTFVAVDVGNLIHINAGTSWTQGWYEILSVAAGVATLDRSPSAAGNANKATWSLGGAISLGSSTANRTDASFFAVTVAGNRVFIASGSFTLAAAVAVTAGSVLNPVVIQGYGTTRGNVPSASSRPVLTNNGAITFTTGADNHLYHLVFKGTTSSATTSSGSRTVWINCKGVNTSSGNAFGLQSNTRSVLINCEALSYRGTAINCGTNAQMVAYCYVHDSDIGVSGNAASFIFLGNIVASCVTAAVDCPATTNAQPIIFGNTLYGAENKLGVGIRVATASTQMQLILNNVIAGFVTGLSHADANQNGGYSDYNDFYNNTTDRSNFAAGPNDVAVNPSFVDVVQRTGSTATTTAGNHLVQAGATFVTWGVTAGRDFVYIKSGTSVTAGIYGILSVDSETQITVDVTLTANATADKVWQITTGQNFLIGSNLKALGFPGAFPASLTTGYLDIGAVQLKSVALPFTPMGVM